MLWLKLMKLQGQSEILGLQIIQQLQPQFIDLRGFLSAQSCRPVGEAD